MKADHNSHETGTRLPCREHAALCLSLFTFMFVPAVAGEIALGRWLTQFMPHPGLIAMLCFAPAIVVLFIFGTFIGATIWLLLTKRFVLQNTLATFSSEVHASRSSLIFAQRYLPGLTARTDGKQNYELAFAGCWRRKARVRNLSSAILPDSSRRGIHMTSNHRPERRIML